MKNIVLIIVGIVILGAVGFGGYKVLSNNTESSDVQSSQTTDNNVTNPTESNQSQTYTLSQVQEHSTPNDCWMAISGNVYNVTSYVNTHPGGRVITQGCGKDATKLFETQNGEGSHSSDAKDQLAEFKIGTLQN